MKLCERCSVDLERKKRDYLYNRRKKIDEIKPKPFILSKQQPKNYAEMYFKMALRVPEDTTFRKMVVCLWAKLQYENESLLWISLTWRYVNSLDKIDIIAKKFSAAVEAFNKFLPQEYEHLARLTPLPRDIDSAKIILERFENEETDKRWDRLSKCLFNDVENVYNLAEIDTENKCYEDFVKYINDPQSNYISVQMKCDREIKEAFWQEYYDSTIDTSALESYLESFINYPEYRKAWNDSKCYVCQDNMYTDNYDMRLKFIPKEKLLTEFRYMGEEDFERNHVFMKVCKGCRRENEEKE